MKKNILLLLSLIMMSANMLAEELTATLQQGSNMKAFFGKDAFKQAYEAAKDGAIITLSTGTFNPVESIEKSISIIGTYAFSEYSYNTYINSTKIKADNVKMEGLYFSDNVELGKISNCHIKRCWLNNRLTSTETHTNTYIEQCVVKYDFAIGTGENYIIKNTTLCGFYTMNTIKNKAQITNCVIWVWCSGSGYSGDSNVKQPYATYMNNVLGGYNSGDISYTCNEASEFYYNYFIKTYSTSSAYSFSISYPQGCVNQGNYSVGNAKYSYHNAYYNFPADYNWDEKKGMDGTIVGILGGSGFNEYPSIPRITSSSIDNHTDSQGKINVKISAAASSN